MDNSLSIAHAKRNVPSALILILLREHVFLVQQIAQAVMLLVFVSLVNNFSPFQELLASQDVIEDTILLNKVGLVLVQLVKQDVSNVHHKMSALYASRLIGI